MKRIILFAFMLAFMTGCDQNKKSQLYKDDIQFQAVAKYIDYVRNKDFKSAMTLLVTDTGNPEYNKDKHEVDLQSMNVMSDVIKAGLLTDENTWIVGTYKFGDNDTTAHNQRIRKRILIFVKQRDNTPENVYCFLADFLLSDKNIPPDIMYGISPLSKEEFEQAYDKQYKNDF